MKKTLCVLFLFCCIGYGLEKGHPPFNPNKASGNINMNNFNITGINWLSGLSATYGTGQSTMTINSNGSVSMEQGQLNTKNIVNSGTSTFVGASSFKGGIWLPIAAAIQLGGGANPGNPALTYSGSNFQIDGLVNKKTYLGYYDNASIMQITIDNSGSADGKGSVAICPSTATAFGRLDASTFTTVAVNFGTVIRPKSGTSPPTTTTIEAGSMFWDSDNVCMYVATETVAGVQSWKALFTALVP